MCCSELKLNGDKSELLVISSRYRPRPLLSSLTIGCSASAWNLGVVTGNGLTFEKHIGAICKLAFYDLRRIAKIRSYLSEESTIALIHPFITCRLDKGNALLYRLPKYQIQRLQSVHNCTTRLDKRHPKFGRPSPLLFELRWLPLQHRIVFKILLLVFKSVNPKLSRIGRQKRKNIFFLF